MRAATENAISSLKKISPLLALPLFSSDEPTSEFLPDVKDKAGLSVSLPVILRKHNMVAFSGNPLVGKSELCKSIVREWARGVEWLDRRGPVFYVDLSIVHDIVPDGSFETMTLHQYIYAYCKYFRFSEDESVILSECVRKNFCMVFIDGINASNSFWVKNNVYNCGPFMYIIIVARPNIIDTFLSDIWNVFDVTGFDLVTQENYLAPHFVDHSMEHVMRFVTTTFSDFACVPVVLDTIIVTYNSRDNNVICKGAIFGYLKSSFIPTSSVFSNMGRGLSEIKEGKKRYSKALALIKVWDGETSDGPGWDLIEMSGAVVWTNNKWTWAHPLFSDYFKAGQKLLK